MICAQERLDVFRPSAQQTLPYNLWTASEIITSASAKPHKQIDLAPTTLRTIRMVENALTLFDQSCLTACVNYTNTVILRDGCGQNETRKFVQMTLLPI